MDRFRKLAFLAFLLAFPMLIASMAISQPLRSKGTELPNGDRVWDYGWLQFSAKGSGLAVGGLDTIATTTPDTTITWIHTYGADEIALYIETDEIADQDSLIIQYIGTVTGDLYDTPTAIDTMVTASLDWNQPFTSALVSTAAQFDRIKVVVIQANGAAGDSLTVRMKAKVLRKAR